jgi:hypothetical protein
MRAPVDGDRGNLPARRISGVAEAPHGSGTTGITPAVPTLIHQRGPDDHVVADESVQCAIRTPYRDHDLLHVGQRTLGPS